jgi:amino acid transporter
MEVRFKAASLAPVQTWRISDKVLVEPYGESTDLSTLMRINFFTTKGKRMWFYSFTLVKPTGEEVPITCNDSTGLQLQNYFNLIFAILDLLKLYNPNLKIHIGGIYIFRASSGIFLLGIGLFMLNLVKGINDGITLTILIILVAFSILGGAYLFFYNMPWTKKTALTPPEFEEWLWNELNKTFKK